MSHFNSSIYESYIEQPVFFIVIKDSMKGNYLTLSRRLSYYRVTKDEIHDYVCNTKETMSF